MVGYSEVGLRSGYVAQGSCFLPVSGDKIDLNQITVVGYNKEDGSEDEVNIQLLDSRGAMVTGSNYYWIDIVDGEDVYYGWMNGDGDIIEDGVATFSAGEALWIAAPSVDYKFMYSGQVDKLGTAVSLRDGYKLVANPTPVTVDLNDIIVKGYNVEDGSEDEVNIQSLDYRGAMVTGSNYYWIDVVDGEDVYYGWMNGDGDIIEDGTKILNPGEALWVNAPAVNYTIEFPKAL